MLVWQHQRNRTRALEAAWLAADPPQWQADVPDQDGGAPRRQAHTLHPATPVLADECWIAYHPVLLLGYLMQASSAAPGAQLCAIV